MIKEMIINSLVSAVRPMWKQAMRAVARRNAMPLPPMSENNIAFKARDHKLG